jgi:hypothetical protein
MSYLRGPVTLAEMAALQDRVSGPAEVVPRPTGPNETTDTSATPPVLESALPARFALASTAIARPAVLIRNRVVVSRKSLDFYRRIDEVWNIPIGEDGRLDWMAAESLTSMPELLREPPSGMAFPKAAPQGLGDRLRSVERDFVVWRAREPVEVLANTALDLVADPDEGREAFVDRCMEIADRADDATQDKVRARYEGRMKSVKTRLEREMDELERDRQKLASRKAEETLGLVEGLFSVLLGSKSVSSASRKAASKMKTAAGKRRMRQTAEGSVVESEREIDRLQLELQELAEELQEEVDRIAEESMRAAEAVEVLPVRPLQRDVEVIEVLLSWS